MALNIKDERSFTVLNSTGPPLKRWPICLRVAKRLHSATTSCSLKLTIDPLP
jgi:hypothetical protein